MDRTPSVRIRQDADGNKDFRCVYKDSATDTVRRASKRNSTGPTSAAGSRYLKDSFGNQILVMGDVREGLNVSVADIPAERQRLEYCVRLGVREFGLRFPTFKEKILHYFYDENGRAIIPVKGSGEAIGEWLSQISRLPKPPKSFRTHRTFAEEGRNGNYHMRSRKFDKPGRTKLSKDDVSV